MKLIVLAAAIVAAPTIAAAEEGYGGIVGGVGSGTAEWTIGNRIEPIDGFTLGVTLGYRAEHGDFVYGIEGDYQLANIAFENSFSHSQTLEHFGTLRGVFGVPLDPITLYATGGVAFGSLAFDSGVLPFDPIENQWAFGFTGGVGAEVAVSETVSLKADYLSLWLGETEFDSTLLGTVGFDTKAQVARLGVNISF